jgi:hypothetical protein
LNRLALATLCVLPALGTRVHTPHTSYVASFMYACDASTPDPYLRTKSTFAGRLKPRPRLSPVEIYQRGQSPTRHYQLVGEVQVLASSGRMTLAELTDWALRGARKLGGDAIVDVTCVDAASAQPKAGDVGLLYLTASVVRWE